MTTESRARRDAIADARMETADTLLALLDPTCTDADREAAAEGEVERRLRAMLGAI